MPSNKISRPKKKAVNLANLAVYFTAVSASLYIFFSSSKKAELFFVFWAILIPFFVVYKLGVHLNLRKLKLSLRGALATWQSLIVGFARKLIIPRTPFIKGAILRSKRLFVHHWRPAVIGLILLSIGLSTFFFGGVNASTSIWNETTWGSYASKDAWVSAGDDLGLTASAS